MGMRRTIVSGVGALLIAAGAVLAGEGVVGAEPLSIDRAVPINGAPADGYPRAPLLTPRHSPIQIPVPTVVPVEGGAKNVVYPYISPWLHDLIPVPADTAFEAAGTVELALPGTGDSVNPAGHCLFAGPETAVSDTASGVNEQIPLPVIRIDTPVIKVSIDPSLWVPAT